jgi:hypothetical protein
MVPLAELPRLIETCLRLRQALGEELHPPGNPA